MTPAAQYVAKEQPLVEYCKESDGTNTAAGFRLPMASACAAQINEADLSS